MVDSSKDICYNYHKEKRTCANKSNVAVLRTVAYYKYLNDLSPAKLNGHFLLLVFITRIIKVANAIMRLNV